MQPHHNYSFREQDADKMIAQFGRKPSAQMRDKIQSKLKAERKNFKSLRQENHLLRSRMEQIKAKMDKRSRGQSM